jgi:prolyl 4-hydroxylase
MRAHKINASNNFIAGWYIDHKICDNLIDDFEQKVRSGLSRTKETPKNYTGVSINSINKSILNKYLNNYLQPCLESYLKLYHQANNCQTFKLTEGNIQRYDSEKFYDVYHFENDGEVQRIYRHLVFMTYLNTIDSGGHTKFLYQNTSIKPEKGLTLIWPAQWTHAHTGTYTKEIKYICTGWYNFVY